MNIVPFMSEQVLTDGVYHLPDGRVFHAQPVRYYRASNEFDGVCPVDALDAPKAVSGEALESLISHLLTQEALDNFGAAYVSRQVEWAESELQKLLTQKSSSLPADAHQVNGQAAQAARSPSAAERAA